MDYNIHYSIKMAKKHIMMKDGKPFLFTTTNGNNGDNSELRKLLKSINSIRKSGCFLINGGYKNRETYVDV